MKRAIYTVFLLANLLVLDAVASSTVELARPEVFSRLQDFSADATHLYVAYELVDTAQPRPNHDRPIMLGIHSRANGVETVRVDVGDVWPAPPQRPRVRTVAYGGRVVVSADDNVALVDRTGNVAARRRVPGFRVSGLGRHRDFVLASGREGLALFDERLDLKHGWSAPAPLVVARATADVIVVLDGTADSPFWMTAGTVRWLALARDQLVELGAVEVPMGFSLVPPPNVLIWDDGALLVAQSNDGWQSCELTFPGEISCMPAAWGAELAATIVERQRAGVTVFRSGSLGYAVIAQNGCTLWTRRYSIDHLIAPQQYVLPSGGSDLGVVNDFLVKQSADDVLMLTSTAVGGRSWNDGANRIALHTPGLSDWLPVPARPVIEGCWSDGFFGTTLAEDGTELPSTADDVTSCVARGADPNAVFNCGEWTRPLNQASRLDNAPAMRALIASGAEVNARDEEGDTALHLAARYAGSDASLKVLLDGGADTALRNNAGYRPWDYAKENKSLVGSPVLRLLQGD